MKASRLRRVIPLALIFMLMAAGTSQAASGGTAYRVGLKTVKQQRGTWICLYNADDVMMLRYRGQRRPSVVLGYGQPSRCVSATSRYGIVVKAFNYYVGYTWGLKLYRNGTLVWQDVEGSSGYIGANENDWRFAPRQELIHAVYFAKDGFPLHHWTVAPR
jgi:hypothetical protein